jgi:hypothetical protein
MSATEVAPRYVVIDTRDGYVFSHPAARETFFNMVTANRFAAKRNDELTAPAYKVFRLVAA